MSMSKLWELVMDREAWRAAIHGVTKTRTRLRDWTELNWSGPAWFKLYWLRVDFVQAELFLLCQKIVDRLMMTGSLPSVYSSDYHSGYFTKL